MLPTLRTVLLKSPYLRLPYDWQFTAGMPPWLSAGAWAAAGGVATGTPGRGENLVTNGEFSANTTGWAPKNDATITRRDYASSPAIAPTGGADNYGMEIGKGGVSSYPHAQFAVIGVIGAWYVMTARQYAPSANTATQAASLQLWAGTSGGLSRRISADDIWESAVLVNRCVGNTTVAPSCYGSNLSDGDVAHFDAIQLYQLTLATLFGGPPLRLRNANARIRLAWTTADTGLCHGGALTDHPSNPTGGLVWHRKGANMVLTKFTTPTTWVDLIDAAAAYVAGAEPEVRVNGSTVQLFYNNAQVGAGQTVAEVQAFTWARAFTTSSTNQLSRLRVEPT